MAGDRRVARTKTALTGALFELLAEKEFSKISVTELARRADVDRKTFYLHYQTVEDILVEFYEEELAGLEVELEHAGIFQGETVDMPGFFRVLCGRMTADMPLFRRLAQGGGYTYFIEHLRALLRHAIGDSLRRQGGRSETERAFLEEFYAAGIMRVYLQWLKGDLEMNETVLAETVGKVVTGALSL